MADSSRSLPPRSSGLAPGPDSLTVSTLQAKLAAQIAGLGVGFLPAHLAGPALAEGRLVRLEVEEPKGRTRVHFAWRPRDAGKLNPMAWLALQGVRGISGMRPAPSLTPLMGRINRPVLLIAGSGFPQEIPANRRYQAAGGPRTELLVLDGVGHTAGLRARPQTYESRTIAFLKSALPAG